MPFIEISAGIKIGSLEVEGRFEDAIRFQTAAGDEVTFVETERGTQLRLEEAIISRAPDGSKVVRVRYIDLDADQVNALGRFCAKQFMSASAGELLARIEGSSKMAIFELEAWNDRARIDEEHPPYDRICNRLREVESALFELRKGLSDPEKRHGQ